MALSDIGEAEVGDGAGLYLMVAGASGLVFAARYFFGALDALLTLASIVALYFAGEVDARLSDTNGGHTPVLGLSFTLFLTLVGAAIVFAVVFGGLALAFWFGGCHTIKYAANICEIPRSLWPR